MDFGKFGVKVAKSFEAYIMNSIVKAMLNCVTNRNTLGIGGYYKVGATTDNWINLAQTVSAANGGAKVYALGTLGALSQIIPDEAGFRFTSDDDLVTQGYLPVYKNVSAMELKQAIVPTTLNGMTPTLVVPDDYIYFIPMGHHKPVHVVYEGTSTTITTDPMATKDVTLGLTITLRIGIDVIVGSKFGIIDVSND